MGTRLATTSDIAAIATLLGVMRDTNVDTAELHDIDLFQRSTDRAIVLAEDNDVVIGMAVVNMVYKLPKRECRVDEVIVMPDNRGKGVGASLIAACEAWARASGATAIELTSRPSREAANKLYVKQGFTLRETNVYWKGVDT